MMTGTRSQCARPGAATRSRQEPRSATMATTMAAETVFRTQDSAAPKLPPAVPQSAKEHDFRL